MKNYQVFDKYFLRLVLVHFQDFCVVKSIYSKHKSYLLITGDLNMKRTLLCLLSAAIIFAGCSNAKACAETLNGSTTNYVDSTTAAPGAGITEDL